MNNSISGLIERAKHHLQQMTELIRAIEQAQMDGGQSVETYRCLKWARWLQEILDGMVKSGLNRHEIRTADERVDVRTLQTRCRQAFRYLCDHLDASGEYKNRVRFEKRARAAIIVLLRPLELGCEPA